MFFAITNELYFPEMDKTSTSANSLADKVVVLNGLGLLVLLLPYVVWLTSLPKGKAPAENVNAAATFHNIMGGNKSFHVRS